MVYRGGVAVIEHSETGEHHEIFPVDLEWDTTGGSERSMGPEIVYGAILDHPSLGEISWSIVEYPAGAEGMKETKVGKHKLIRDFEYGLEHEIEDGPIPEDLVEWLRKNSDYASKLPQQTLVSFLVDWFYHFFEDPANDTPYNSRKGGYQYIVGGPYDAESELRGSFESIVPEDAILKAVEEVQSDGIYHWAPSSWHSDRVSAANEALAEKLGIDEFTFEDLRAIAVSSKAPGLNSQAERAKRLEVKERIIAFEESLPVSSGYGGIGHNEPPDEFAIDRAGLSSVREELEAIKSELAVSDPSVGKVAERASKLSRIVGWVSGKLDKTVEEFCKAFGATLGKATGAAVPAFVIAWPYWAKLAELLTSLKDWLIIALGIG